MYANFLFDRRIVWVNADASSGGTSYQFRDISMHAVASEDVLGTCLYCHVGMDEVNEVRFTPRDASSGMSIGV